MAGDNEPALGEAIIAWIESECRCHALASLLATRPRLTPGRDRLVLGIPGTEGLFWVSRKPIGDRPRKGVAGRRWQRTKPGRRQPPAARHP
jgi:hypothetical protein